MIYFEQQDARGQWWPRSSTNRPREPKRPGHEGIPSVRKIVTIAAEHETLGLTELQAIYGTPREGEAA